MTAQPLKGLRILVTAYDLEQGEHRGIAVYSKSVLRCLKQAGAEVWLLTEFFDKLSEKGLRRLPGIHSRSFTMLGFLTALLWDDETNPHQFGIANLNLCEKQNDMEITFA